MAGGGIKINNIKIGAGGADGVTPELTVEDNILWASYDGGKTKKPLGPAGAKGETGAQGPQGEQGRTGPQGPTGVTLVSQVRDDDYKGTDGYKYIQTFDNNTTAEFIAPKGPPGLTKEEIIKIIQDELKKFTPSDSNTAIKILSFTATRVPYGTNGPVTIRWELNKPATKVYINSQEVKASEETTQSLEFTNVTPDTSYTLKVVDKEGNNDERSVIVEGYYPLYCVVTDQPQINSVTDEQTITLTDNRYTILASKFGGKNAYIYFVSNNAIKTFKHISAFTYELKMTKLDNIELKSGEETYEYNVYRTMLLRPGDYTIEVEYYE